MRDEAGPPAPDRAGSEIAGFRVEELLETHGDMARYTARDERVDRRVQLRVAGEATVDQLLDDARRLAAVSHASLVQVLGAGRHESGGYAALQDADALPLGEAEGLSSDQAARVAIDVAGALAALAAAGLRAAVTERTVLVARTPEGLRGLLDPLRALQPGASCLSEVDAIASTRELADLIRDATPSASADLLRAADSVARGASTGPAEFAAMLAPLVLGKRVKRRRAGVIVAGLLVLAAAAAAIIVRARDDGGRPPAAPAAGVPAARIVARIPLGMRAGEGSTAFASLGASIWITTNKGRLLRVDGGTNAVAGTAIELGDGHAIRALAVSGGMLYTVDAGGWILRIDPQAGRVTARRRFGMPLATMTASSGVLWVASDRGASGSLIRVDAATLRTLGRPVAIPPASHAILVRASRAWVLGGSDAGTLTRVAVATGAQTVTYVGPQPFAAALHGGTVWLTDSFNGTVSSLDAARMAFDRAPARTQRAAVSILPAASDLWVTSTTGAFTQLRLERIEGRSGRRVGRPVPIGPGGIGIIASLGALWMPSGSDLVRLAPAIPRPALDAPVGDRRSPRSLTAGPLPAATWRADSFAVPFTFATPAFTWLGVFPQADSVDLLGARDRRLEVGVLAPRQMFAGDSTAHTVARPGDVLKLLQGNRHLRVSRPRHVTVGGRAAVQVVVRNQAAERHPDVCGPRPCTLLFPVREATVAVLGTDLLRLTLLTSAGRTLVVTEGYDQQALPVTRSLVKTFRFRA